MGERRTRNGQLRSQAWVLYLIAGGLVTATYFTVPHLRGNGLVFGLLGISAAAAMVAGALASGGAPRTPWMVLAVAQLLFVLGDLVYYVYDIKFPNVGDVFYLAFYPVQVAGLLLLIRRRTPGKDRASLLDASIITVGLGVLAWVFLMQPFARQGDLQFIERAVSMAYPLMDVLLIAVAARLAFGAGARPPAFYLLAAGVVSLLVTDAIYGYIQASTGYTVGGFLDVGWIVFYLLSGAAALHPSMVSLSARAPDYDSNLTGRRLLLLTGATLIAPAMEVVEWRRSGDLRAPVPAIAAAVLFLLVLARMNGLVGSLRAAVASQRRSVEREAALRRATVALSAGSDRDAIRAAALDAVRELTSDVLGVEVDVDLGAVPCPAGRSGVDAAAGMPRASAVAVVPMSTQTSRYGSISVAGADRLPGEVVDCLRTLGSQAALALETASLAEDLRRREGEERAGALVQHSSDVITVVDADLVIRYESPSVRQVLGYEPAALLGTRLIDLIDGGDRAQAEPHLAGIVANPGAGPVVRWRIRRADGSLVDVEAVCNNLLRDARIGGIVVTVRDISERIALEEGLTRQVDQLRELDGIKTDLVSTVSHELRSPLTSIMGNTELLMDGDAGPLTADQARLVGIIDRNGHRLLALIEDLLLLSRVESRRLAADMVPTDVAEVVENVRTAIVPAVAARSQSLAVTIDPELVEVVADGPLMERALTNLMSNAVKFTPEGGQVVLSAERRGAEAVFTVSDTGVGIAAEDQPRIFTRFFRSASATLNAVPGTGLGLSIVKQIADEHGGRVSVESVLGEGTVVSFAIPLAVRPTPEPVPGSARR